ncbi:hypothetical protein Pan14r_51670 [Crateriforma conspicua]|uniref:Uncharacterized protein n=2 Tax=Crateriforma conspicua TaxID=2527996 RepID=A0A5C5XRZ2_9PLAN|nr:hypothetical protein Mal65_54270 [Crateriforma conspicua]TWT65620.1 hypothetical protein Pan14r_51670 [Crateriforma conspicua]
MPPIVDGMADPSVETITDQIASNAAEPASASGDGHSAAQHSLREQIEADKYLRSVKAAEGRKSLKQKIGLGRFVPPGACG